MRRLVAPALAAVLALHAPAVRAEPLDVDLVRLGAPDPQVWIELGNAQATPIDLTAQSATLASEAKQRFGILSAEVALALSGPLLQPASTTGHSGFDVAIEGAYAQVHGDAIGSAPPLGFSNEPWTTRSVTPGSLTTTGVHVRKALPFSFELGGRLTYLAKSSYFGAQGEAKWALNEGFEYIPDLAVRVAYTRLFGQREWNLSATDVDFMVSKRFGVQGVTSFTPYLAARFTFVSASTDMLDFGPFRTTPPPTDPVDQNRTVARFPKMSTGLYRTTLGVRMTAHVVSLAVEGTYFGGKSYSGEAAPSRDDYPDFEIDSSFSAALKLGWEF